MLLRPGDVHAKDAWPRLEPLEPRVLMSGDGLLPVPEPEPQTGSAEAAWVIEAEAAEILPDSTSLSAPEAALGDLGFDDAPLLEPTAEPLATPSPDPGASGPSASPEERSLQGAPQIPDLVDPALATTLLPGPGRTVLDVPASGVGLAALWRFALPETPGNDPATSLRFQLRGITPVPADTAIAWYSESGSLLAVGDGAGANLIASDNLDVSTWLPGRTYLIGVHTRRAIDADALRLEVLIESPSLATPVALNARTGQASLGVLDWGDAFVSPADLRWHPLDLLNASTEATLTVTPEISGQHVTLSVYRKVPPSTQLAGSGSPTYTRIGTASSSAGKPAQFVLRAPSGTTLNDQEYVLAVAPKDYASGATGYQITVESILPLPALAAMSANDVAGSPTLLLQPTAQPGLATATLSGQSAVGDAARIYRIRAPSTAPMEVRVTAGFDAIVSLYSGNRALLQVATESRQGVVTLAWDAEASNEYFIRVANGPETNPREGTGFSLEIEAVTNPGRIDLAAPASGSYAREAGGSTFLLSPNGPARFLELYPAPGIDVVILRLGPPGGSSLRIAVHDGDTLIDRTFAAGETMILPVVVTRQGQALQVAVQAISGGSNPLLYYNAITLPRELAIGTLTGQKLAPADGTAERASLGFDRAGDIAGFEFYQGLTQPGQTGTWTATPGGGALPILARYTTQGSVLKLVDWTLPDPDGIARLQAPARDGWLNAAAAFQVARQDGGTVTVRVDQPTPIPVGVGMVPDLAYEDANPNPARFRYILQIRSVTLERTFEEDYWETILPDRFFAGSVVEDPAAPILDIRPDTPGSALRLRVFLQDGEGNPLRRFDGSAVQPFTSSTDGSIQVDFSTLGVFRQALEGRNIRFRVESLDGALGDGAYSLRLTVRTPDPNPYEVDELRWAFPGGGTIPNAVGSTTPFPAGTEIRVVPQDPSGEGVFTGRFTNTAVGVHLYQFATPVDGPFRAWTVGTGNDPANTTIRIYRARHAVTTNAERGSWWETIDYLEALDGVGASLDWYPADRSEIDAQILIQDPEFPAYKKPTNDLGQSTSGNVTEANLGLPFLPADRQFTDTQHVYYVVVKNEQGSTGDYRIHVSTEDLPILNRDPVQLPQRPTASELRSVLSLPIPGVEDYRNRIGVIRIQMPQQHTGYLGVRGETGAQWDLALFDEAGTRLNFLGITEGERRYAVPQGAQSLRLRVLEVSPILESYDELTFTATLAEDAGLPSNFSSLNLGSVAQTLLPTDPWGALAAGEFSGSAPVNSPGVVFRFRAAPGPLDFEITPAEGSVASFVWGLYDDGRLIAWDRAVPGQPGGTRATLEVVPDPFDTLAGRGRMLLLVVRHASVSTQPARFDVELRPSGAPSDGFILGPSGATAVPLPSLAAESSEPLDPDGPTELITESVSSRSWLPDQWLRFRVPDGPGSAPRLVNLPTTSNLFPLRYDVFNASGTTRVATGLIANPAPNGVELTGLEAGTAYIIRLAPRDQPLAENLPIQLRFTPAKAAQINGSFQYSVPDEIIPQPPSSLLVYPDYRGDFSSTVPLDGNNTVWLVHDVPKPGPVTLTVLLQGSSQAHIALYDLLPISGEFSRASLVDFANESSDEATPDGKKLTLTTFLAAGTHFIEIARSNSNGGTARVDFNGPEYDLERLTPDPNQGVTFRAEMGRTTGTRFFEVFAPPGSLGPATFRAYDLDLLDDRPWITGTDFTKDPPQPIEAALYLRARMQVWTVSGSFQAGGLPSLTLAQTLDRNPANASNPLKATLVTPGDAPPFQRYIIGIQSEGLANGAPTTVSARSVSIGVEAIFQLPVSGTPDLVVDSIRLLPNNGQTLVEISVTNRGYALALDSQSRFSYPSINADDPITALLFEGVLGPQSTRIHSLDWINPSSPDDITRYLTDAAGEIEELDETNNAAEVAMKSVNAARPTFSVSLGSPVDGNASTGIWGRYLDSRVLDSVKVLSDIILQASDADDAANTYDGGMEIYLIRSDSPFPYTTGNFVLRERMVLDRVELSALAPTGPNAPNIFSSYAVDRFGLRSDTVSRTVQVVPLPAWMEAGDTTVEFNDDSGRYELEFSARPVEYSATLTEMLDANIPLVGNRRNEFYVEAFASTSFSLNPAEAIAPIHPSIRTHATVLGVEVLNKSFAPGTSSDYVSVGGRIDVRPDTLEASDFELTTRIDGYPIDQWEGPEIPIFGFDAAVVSAAVQAQVLVDLTFDAAVTFTFDLSQPTAPIRITSPSYVGLDLRVELRFEGEVELLGFLDIASVGGGFFFTLKPRYGLESLPAPIPLDNFLTEACLGLSATIGGELSADIFGIEVFSIEMESDEIQLTNCVVATQGLAGPALLPVASPELAAVKPRPNDALIRTRQTILPGTTVLPTPTVRPNPQVVIDPATGQNTVAYLDTQAAGAPPSLFVARGSGNATGTPLALTSTEWMNRPILASTSDGPGSPAVVVYQTAPYTPGTTTASQFLAAQDLKYRYFDGTTWSDEITLTDNATLDWQASMAFNASGDGALVWVANSAAAPVDARGRLTAGADRILVSRWDRTTHRWGTPTTLASSGTHNQPTVAVAPNGSISVAWILGTSAANDRINLAQRNSNGTWSIAGVRDTSLPASGRFRSVALAAEADGRLTLFAGFAAAPVDGTSTASAILTRSGTYANLTGQSAAFQTLATTGGVSSLQVLPGAGNSWTVGWQERRGSFSDAMVSHRQADGTWSRPARITQSTGNERALRLAVTPEGTVISVFERGSHFFPNPDAKPLPADGPTFGLPAGASALLGSARANTAPELAIVGPMLFDGVPASARGEGLAGTETPTSIELRNSGATTANATVTWYRVGVGLPGTTDEALGERKVRLLPGETLPLEFTVTLRSGINRFRVEATLASGNDAFTREDNSVTAQITGRLDLAIENASVTPELGGLTPRTGSPIGIRTELVNLSGVAFSGPVEVTTFWIDPSKPGQRNILTTGTADLRLEPFERRVLPFLVTFEQPGLRRVGITINPAPLQELATGNNTTTVPVDLRPDLALQDVARVVRGEVIGIIPAISAQVTGSSGVDNAVVRVAVTNVGSAPIRSFTLTLHHAVDDRPAALHSTRTVTGLLGPGESQLVEIKASALAGTNTYRAAVAVSVADLPTGLPEPDTSNNVASTSVVLQGLSDLSVRSATFATPSGNPPQIRIGGPARIDVSVLNSGIAGAKGIVVEAFAQSPRQIGLGILVGSVTLASLDALASATVQITLNTHLFPETATTLVVMIDRQQAILEISDFNNSATRPFTVAPPAFLSTQTWLNEGVGQLSKVGSLTVAFNRDFATPAQSSILILEDLTTGRRIDPALYTVSSDAARRTLTFTFSGLPGGNLPAGSYSARLAVASLSDRGSNPLGREVALRFTVTPGDANGDGTTNERDYLAIWRELRKAEADRNLKLDVNGDGKLTTTDLDLVREGFGRTGAPAGAIP
jgi:hypothetical protein